MLDKHTKGERFMKKTKGMLLCATLLLGATYVPVAGAIADGVTPSVDARQGEGEVDPLDPTQPVDPTPVDPTPVKPTPVNFDLDKGSVTTQTGQTIIGTEDSKPIIQLADGTVKKVEPKEVGATVQKDGTVKVKGKDGKMNVLPHTGSENNIFLSLLGGVTTLITGGIAFILKRKLG